jgi:hypothetical protein
VKLADAFLAAVVAARRGAELPTAADVAYELARLGWVCDERSVRDLAHEYGARLADPVSR